MCLGDFVRLCFNCVCIVWYGIVLRCIVLSCVVLRCVVFICSRDCTGEVEQRFYMDIVFICREIVYIEYSVKQ